MMKNFKRQGILAISILLFIGAVGMLPNHARAAWEFLGTDEDSTTTQKWTSPDRTVETVSLRMADIYSMKAGKREFAACAVLLVRLRNAESSLCLGLYKAFNVFWSQDSKYLAVGKEYSTHNSDIDIYKVETDGKSKLALKLIFHRDALDLPAGRSWVNWEFVAWHLDKGTVEIREVDENKHPFKKKVLNIKLNSKPIKIIVYTQQ